MSLQNDNQKEKMKKVHQKRIAKTVATKPSTTIMGIVL